MPIFASQWEYKTRTFQPHQETSFFQSLDDEGWEVIAIVPFELEEGNHTNALSQVRTYKAFLKRPRQQP